MISVKNLVKRYDQNEPAVKGVSFNIDKGEIVGLLGPNGAGKTTIMRMLTCYMNPTSGEAIIDGKSTMDYPIDVKKNIGYLPENTTLYTDMTVYEYLNFIAEIRGLSKDEIPNAIKKMVKLTSLEDVITKKINQLSHGYKKRVGLASVMIHDPKILILDEPTTGLDPNQIMMFRKMLRRLSEKKTVILSTHILSEIEAICERVIIIRDGSIAADDSLQSLISKYSDDQYVDFSIQANNLLELEQALGKIKGAWKLEFVKKEAKDVFNFRALVSKNTKFEDELKDLLKKNNWKLMSSQRHRANLEEIFLKLTGEEK
jgi:ABC-2 type transport system ATP-binding protein